MATLNLTKNPIKSTIVFSSAVLGTVLCAQALSLVLFGFTSECGVIYIATAGIMTVGSLLCLFIERYNQERAITFLCYMIYFGISGMVALHCTSEPTEFPKILSVLLCGILVLRWSGLKRRAVAYGFLSAITIGLAAWACSSAIGATGVAFSILSTFLPRDKA